MTLENYYLINKIFFILSISIVITISFWVYFANRKRKEHQLFFLTSLFITIWITFGFFAHIGQDYSLALIWTKIAAASALFFLVTSFFFIIHFLIEEKVSNLIKKIILLLGLVIGGITMFSSLFFSGVLPTKWGFLPQSGKMWIIYNIFAICMGVLILLLTIKKYFKISQEQKFKMQYFLIGFLIFLLMNIVFNTILPTFYQTYYLYQFGNYSAIFFLGLTAYAIMARELFGIRVILTQSLVIIIAILLLWQAVVAIPDWFDFSWKSGLFLIFAYFGYLLIQSVIREIRRREEVERLSLQLRAANVELDRVSRAKTEFISIASHQLRTPLTVIKGYISMILEGSYGEFPERAREKMENTYVSNERLIKLINELLNVSRLESGKLEYKFERAFLEEIITSVVEELEIKAKEKKLKLEWEKPAKPLPRLLIDADKIRQVIFNVIDNAIKYTKKGAITIEGGRMNSEVRIKISDTGEGMTEEELSYLFESFSRGKAGVELEAGGIGLGLYIAKKFVEVHNGKIWAESEGKGKGSTFYIELPVK